MCKQVDKVIQMIDGKVARVITDKEVILKLAGTSDFEVIENQVEKEVPEEMPIPVTNFPINIPVAVGAD
jgi:hypothetical protein